MQIADSFRFRWQFGPLFFTILTACLICTNRLSWHILTTPLLTAFLISIPTSLLPKILRTVVQIAIGETVVAVCLVDAYCQIYLKVPISPHIFSVISQTNLSEAGEFLSTFIGPSVFLQWRIIGLLLVGVLFPLSYIPAIKIRIEKRLLHLFPKGRRTCIVITVLLVICLVVELPATIRFLQFFRHRANPDFVESLIFRIITKICPRHCTDLRIHGKLPTYPCVLWKCYEPTPMVPLSTAQAIAPHILYWSSVRVSTNIIPLFMATLSLLHHCSNNAWRMASCFLLRML